MHPIDRPTTPQLVFRLGTLPLVETDTRMRRFETPPGHQAQVDWGQLGVLEQAAERQKVWGFVFTVGYSRAMAIDVALDQRLETFLRLDEEAFHQLGG